jgi:hypothetical protein
LESRIRIAAREKKPWEFFWVLRGGWQTASREFSTLRQFPNANAVLAIIAIGQVVSCDAGVTREWLVRQAQAIGISESDVDKAIDRLDGVNVVIAGEELRTKHLQYAFQLLEETFTRANRSDWDPIRSVYVATVVDRTWSLKGASWLLDAVIHSDAFKYGGPRSRVSSIIEPLIERCTSELSDIDWAAGCLSRVFNFFDVPVENMMTNRELLLRWTVRDSGLAAYFCSNIINRLINESKDDGTPGRKDIARSFIDDVDVAELVAVANRLRLEEFYHFGSLLNRLAYYGPRWSEQFIQQLDWGRLKAIILAADADKAYAIDKMLYCVCRLAECANSDRRLQHLEEVIPYVVKAVNLRPARNLNDLDDTFWLCLGYAPKFLRGGHSPDANQRRVAHAIVSQFDPKAFAEALTTSSPRDLESLSRSFAIIHEVEPKFLVQVGACLSEEKFFASTSDEWRLQSDELQHILGFFAQGKEMQPARTWVKANQNVIEGPLRTRLACIAPEVAVSFHKSGQGVAIVDASEPTWNETCLAIARIMALDHALCVELVGQQMSDLEQALYRLSLRPLTWIAKFFRLLHEVSPTVFDKFVDQLNLDNPEAKKTIDQLVRTQPKERRNYMKLARAGRLFPGKIGQLSKSLWDRLQEH